MARCPTCPDAKENRCCGFSNHNCQTELPADRELSTYAEEIHGDDRLHLQCSVCIILSCAEI